jgi:arylsulfatase A-like enzyme
MFFSSAQAEEMIQSSVLWMRRKIIPLLIFFALGVALSCTSSRKEERPNIILISIDALRADHLSLYGYPYQTSPHIDEFAKRSTVFEYAYGLIPKTSASFASLMTGLHPFIHRTQPNQDSLNEKFITLAEALKLRDYSTAAIVDNSNLSPRYKFNQGFDRYTTVWEDREKREESTPYITQKVLEFLADPPGKPFFLWAHYIEPHFPYVPPSRFIEDRPEGRTLAEIPSAIIVSNSSTAVDLQSKEGHYLALYDGAIKYVDSEFDKIMSVITKNGSDRNSIIIVTADHGEELGEHNLFYDHGPLAFNSSLRIPLIVFLPGETGRRITYPVSLMDIYPTLLEKAGLVPPYPIQGKNLFLEKGRGDLFLLAPPGSRALISSPYHLVDVLPPFVDELGLESVYLFDIYKDPHENENLAQRKTETLRVLQQRLAEFFANPTYSKRAAEEKPEVPLSKRELERLRTLGYIR